MPKTEKKVIQVLDTKDQIVLENYIRKNINRITVGILICLYTGIRIGELCALKEGDIDFKNKKKHLLGLKIWMIIVIIKQMLSLIIQSPRVL